MIIYYSLSGHTKAVATQISEKTGDCLYEIELDKPYKNNPLMMVRFTKEKMTGVIPMVKKIDMIDDIIYLGYPIWGKDMALAMQGFLKANDLSGKTIKPFITSDTSELEISLSTLKKLAPHASIDANFKPENIE